MIYSKKKTRTACSLEVAAEESPRRLDLPGTRDDDDLWDGGGQASEGGEKSCGGGRAHVCGGSETGDCIILYI